MTFTLGDAERGAFWVGSARIREGASAERASVSDEILLGAPHPSPRDCPPLLHPSLPPSLPLGECFSCNMLFLTPLSIGG